MQNRIEIPEKIQEIFGPDKIAEIKNELSHRLNKNSGEEQFKKYSDAELIVISQLLQNFRADIQSVQWDFLEDSFAMTEEGADDRVNIFTSGSKQNFNTLTNVLKNTATLKKIQLIEANADNTCFITNIRNLKPLFPNVGREELPPLTFRSLPHASQLMTDLEKNPDSYSACYEIPYRNQPSIFGGTGFLLASNLVLTAGHIIDPYKSRYPYRNPYKNKLRVLTHYRMRDSYSAMDYFDRDKVKKITDIRYVENSYNYDFAIIELNEPIISYKETTINP